MLNQKTVKLLDAVTANANVTSAILDIRSLGTFSVQTIWSGFSGTVSVALQVSNVVPEASTANNWTTINTVSLSGATSNNIFKLDVNAYCFARVVLTQTGGGGTVSAILNGK